MCENNIRKNILINCNLIPDYDEEVVHKILSLFDRCHRFVKDICKGRDESHSVNHLLAVTQNAMIIVKDMLNNNHHIPIEILEDILTCAILHDVADYKYDNNGILSKQVKCYINNICKYNKISTTSPDDIWWIIDNLSFSKEKKAGSLKNLIKNTYTVFPFPHKLIFIRNIVADADRLEAIGEIGAQRCITYGQHANPNITRDQLKQKVKAHAEEKLYMIPFGDPITKEPYFHTSPGKQMALKLHKDTIKYINEFLES